MYRGFELKDVEFSKDKYPTSYKEGEELYKGIKHKVETNLNKFILDNGSLDGTKMQNDWFRLIEADIFISHSHANRDNAITLAGWLLRNFGIRAFIDSCIWGYAEELLWKIDNKYCPGESKGSFDYFKRNYSTSHVHMMLSTALTKMMDKTECLFFLNTPESIIPSVLIEKTESPWIYHEIAMSQLIRQNIPERLKVSEEKRFSIKSTILEKAEKGGQIPQLRVEYETSLRHLVSISKPTLLTWNERTPDNFPKQALNVLYRLVPAKEFDIIVE